MAFPAMPTPVSCPQCNHQFVVNLHTIVDVGQEPELKEQLLTGELNRAVCPNCGAGGLLSTPLVYHDPAKELLITYVPAEMGISVDQQEQLVGGLVNAVMNSMPPEGRKGYFFRPTSALTLRSLFDIILEADGVSREMIEAQQKRIELLNALFDAMEDETSFDSMIEEKRGELDYDFFMLLSALIDSDRERGLDEEATLVEGLRDMLLERVQPAMPASAAPEDASYADVIELLMGAESDERLIQSIGLNLSHLDYGFFQYLTAQIESLEAKGDETGAAELTELRTRILEEIDRYNNMAREAEDNATMFLMDLLSSEDVDAALHEHIGQIDQTFVVVASRYIAAAEKQGNEARAKRIRGIMDSALGVLEENLPPEIRLLNRLMRSEYPDGTNKVLEESRGLLSDDFMAMFDHNLEAIRADDDELADHLDNVRKQIEAKRMIQRL